MLPTRTENEECPVMLPPAQPPFVDSPTAVKNGRQLASVANIVRSHPAVAWINRDMKMDLEDSLSTVMAILCGLAVKISRKESLAGWYQYGRSCGN
ncbi:hypothetical protein BAUCODRAFT_30949 [Baudoinia panamericana UAMH 10762]|uniref:Uncharacterized protein n=1 Tax=Baudoinia panamericana (strain UAMH 10762) TaxID=717646 RepID=M2N3X1_BAUPA|nr:uncharacterized protein BAUCODRAFT_30949 [Baudoinia panamericana UAMH 10762]EMC98683.1 hypothetical protein BAUCODRAFT_30949 [Baudoinia panamericana UAMH 10762]